MSAEAPVGQTWPAQDYEVGREKIREYAAAIGSTAPWHRDHAAARELGYRTVVAPPTFASTYIAAAVATVMFDPTVGVFDPAAGLAGYRLVQRSVAFEFLEPVCSGDRLTTVGSLLEADERDGTIYRWFGSETRRDDGLLVCRGRFEGVVPGPRRSAARTRNGDGEGPVTPATRVPTAISALRRGDRLPPLRETPDRYAPVRYAGASGDFTPFHLDAEFAQSVGLPGVILHGLHTVALLARSLVEPFGGDPRSLRRLSARFKRPAVPEIELAVAGEVESISSEGALVKSMVEQRGRPVLIDGSSLLVAK